MKGLIISPHRNPYPCIQIEIDELLKQPNNTPIIYDEINKDYRSIHTDIENILKEDDYDFIYTWYDKDLLKDVPSLDKFNIPVIMHTGDCWGRLFSNDFMDIVNKHKPKALALVNKCTYGAFDEYLNKDIKFLYSPYSFNPNIMKDYGEEKIYDICFTGKFSGYSDRLEIHLSLTLANEKKRVKYIKHEWVDSIIEYCRNYNKSWLSYSSLQDPDKLYYKDHFIGSYFSKNLEIPACKVGLFSRRFGDADLMGFKDGVNCILYDELEEFPDKVKYYLNDKELLTKLINKGYDLVHNNHTVKIHIDNFLSEIDKFVRR